MAYISDVELADLKKNLLLRMLTKMFYLNEKLGQKRMNLEKHLLVFFLNIGLVYRYF